MAAVNKTMRPRKRGTHTHASPFRNRSAEHRFHGLRPETTCPHLGAVKVNIRLRGANDPKTPEAVAE